MIRVALVLVLLVAAIVAMDPRERIGRALYHAGLPQLAGALLHGPAWDGATLYAQGRFAEAADAFLVAPFEGADYDRGTALARAGRLKEAAEALEKALYRDPNNEDARFNLALVEAMISKAEGAQRDAFNAANASASKQKRGGEAPSDAENEVNSTGEGMAGDRDSGREANTPGGAKVSRVGRAEQSRIDESGGAARGSVGASEGRGRTGDSATVAKLPDQPSLRLQKSYQQQAVAASQQWLETLPDDPGKYLKLKLAAERAERARRGVAAPIEGEQW
jgi:tetratricopeptide (TPR) repeat protein